MKSSKPKKTPNHNTPTHSTVMFFCKSNNAHLALKIYAAKQNHQKANLHSKAVQLNCWLPRELAL